jgi:HAD superfamily hydrolase (TIGR01450 family)
MYKIFILDLDGTVYVDGVPIKNIISQLNKINLDEGLVLFLTNNTSVNKKDYIDKLIALGLKFVKEQNIITPIDIFLSFAKKQNVNSCFYLLPKSVIDEIEINGGPVHNLENPEMVLVGFDKELTYSKTQRACELINSSIPYYITHIDFACPSALGPIPDCGAIASLISTTTDKEWENHFGKPGDYMKERILEIIDNSPFDSSLAVLVGDRYYTDIKLGKLLNIDTVHVNTGEKNKLPEINFEPKFEFQDISKFIEWQYLNK